VLIIEHKQLLQQKELVEFSVPTGPDYIGKAQVVREGADVTIVSSLAALATAREAAELAAGDGVSVEVIDIAWVKPLDDETVRRSVEKTGRLVVFSEDYFEGSWAATLIARLAVTGVELSAPPLVRCLPTDVPIPFAKEVEMALLPDAQQLRRDIVAHVGRKGKGD